MKTVRRLVLVLVASVALPGLAALRHPAMPLNRADLEFLKAHREEMPWKTGWDLLKNDRFSKLTYRSPGARETVDRSPGHGEYNWPWKNDMRAAWNQARMWYFTGDERHAEIARDILMDWATGFMRRANTTARIRSRRIRRS